jgi:hypothetical protein
LWKTIQKVYWSEVYCSEGYLRVVKWSEGPVKIGVLYLWSNNIRN